MEKEKSTSLMKAINWGVQKVKDRDRFATPVQLKFKGDSEFKTGIGGLSSIVMLITLLVYASLLIRQMILKENSVVNSMTMIDNLMYNPSKYNLKDYNFVLSMQPKGFTFLLNSTYFEVNAMQYTVTKQSVVDDRSKFLIKK